MSDSGNTSDRALPAVGTTRLAPRYRIDLRTTRPDVFEDLGSTDWTSLSWRELGRPLLVRNYSRRRRRWEQSHGSSMPVPVQWRHFNRSFQSLFDTSPAEAVGRLLGESARSLSRFQLGRAFGTLKRLFQLRVWNHVHRIQDAVWDPRGKRALFAGLGLKRPRILFLGAADGYEAMQLLAMYPGGHALLVDYDDYCRTDRFGSFPEAYPFLGSDPATGHWSVYRRTDFDIDFEVCDMKDLSCGAEFDVVLSVGLLEHFPDSHKPQVIELHRKFLKPGGVAILTTPRRQLESRLFYLLMGEIMNFGYRELMDARQLGLYVWENGLEVVRAGWIRAHNGVIARPR